MKKIIILCLLLSLPAWAAKKPVKKAMKSSAIEKVPKSLFLIKKAKINAAVGEPQFYPAEAQLRTISHDQLLHNTKKYE